jgi:serine/threonine protein kinase
MADDPNALRPGAAIAGYHIIRVLGAGGFGITYEADSPFTGKRVAIKEFFPRGIASREGDTRIVFSPRDSEIVEWALKRFESSTLDQCRLKHPNIVNVVHYVKDNGTGYMIMEYVEGETLEHFLREHGTPLAPGELQPLLSPVLEALDYLHRQGLIHRDIAPDNIMVRADGRPVIIDFGAIKLIEQETQLRSNPRSFAVMKQFYSPPEQIEADGELDHRADIYSAGAVLYRAFAGRTPVSSEERMQKLAYGKPDPYIPLSTVAPALPPEIANAVDRALSFNAEDRQAEIAELRSDLDWLADGERTEIVRDRTPERDFNDAPPRSRLPWLLPLIGIAALGIAVAYFNGLIALPKFGGEVVQVETPAPKLDDVKEIPQMQVKPAEDANAPKQDSEPQTPAALAKRYTGEVVFYRVVENSPEQALTNCVPGRRAAFSVELEGTALQILHSGNTFVTGINADGSFDFQSGSNETTGLFSRKMRYSGKVTPEAIEGEFVSTNDRGSCYGKLTAKPSPAIQ